MSATPSATTAGATPAPERAARLRVTEIFHSLQGESTLVGLPTVFVRLTGCPLRCVYCDTTYAFHGGESFGIDDVLTRVASFGAPNVCVTGGEPLAQKACLPLLRALCDAGYRVSLETSGALPVAEVDERVIRVVDVKTPGSGEEPRNLYEQLPLLGPRDEIKFVICDRADYDWSLQRVRNLAPRATVLFSPSFGQLAPPSLAAWILEDRAPVRFQLQLHKVLWGDVPGR